MRLMGLMAIVDLHSRYVIGWYVSNSMEPDWCANVAEQAIAQHGKPDIINTNQGGQFTSDIFIKILMDQYTTISMDGEGRVLDNILIERLWRSLKYEHVYLKPAEDGLELFKGIKQYITFYNRERRHQSLGLQTPTVCYLQVAA